MRALMVAVIDCSGLTSSDCALANAVIERPIDCLDRCMARIHNTGPIMPAIPSGEAAFPLAILISGADFSAILKIAII
jgi:hypothetical protein